MNAASQSGNAAAPLLRALIVEDSQLDAGLMVRELERFAYRVEWLRVETAGDLAAALRQEPWDVVLADFSLPSFSGLEAMKLVQTIRPNLPFLLISGTIGEETAVEAMREGASDYLLKDRLARLGPAVQRALLEAGERQARRRAEDLLRRLYHAVEQSPAIIMITDLAGHIEYANPRFTAVTGYALDEVRGRTPNFLKSGQTAPAEYVGIWKTIAAGGQWRGEFANRTKDGRLYWEAAAVSPVRDAAGRITHYVKVAEDITERKRVEESLRKLESQLRQAQRMEAIGELAGGIAHDFNSFLGAIIVNAQMAKAHGPADAAVADYLDRVISGSRQAAGLARQMLTFSRRDDQPRCPVQLGPVVQEALRLLQATQPAHLQVDVQIPAAGRSVLANATQIQEAVINLWTNACHACQTSGGRICISLADVDLNAGPGPSPELPAGRYVRLTIQDDGCGIPAEIQERIFEPFYTTKPAGHGLGLGLPVVRSIMLAHQGAVCVESRPQQGTAFHLFFPEHATQDAGPSGSQPLPCGSGQRILLVDDHALYRNSMQSVLESLGYRVAAFASPVAALAAFRAGADEFDLVLTDLSMREMNGAELARQLLAIRPGLPVILSSGYELAGVAAQVRSLGVREVLTKPVQRGQLAESLARALAQHGKGG